MRHDFPRHGRRAPSAVRLAERARGAPSGPCSAAKRSCSRSVVIRSPKQGTRPLYSQKLHVDFPWET
eukprot:3074207-Pyramimonas_sp.AAC.1